MVAVGDERDSGVVGDLDAAISEQLYGGVADDVGVEPAYAAENHQSGGALADDFVGNRGSAKEFRVGSEQLEEIGHAAASESADVVAVGDYQSVVPFVE